MLLVHTVLSALASEISGTAMLSDHQHAICEVPDRQCDCRIVGGINVRGAAPTIRLWSNVDTTLKQRWTELGSYRSVMSI